MSADQYFASKEPNSLAGLLMGKVDGYYQWLLQTERLGRMRMAYDTYYGLRNNSTSHNLTASGKQGELTLLMSNEYRNLVQHLVILTTQSRQNIEVAASNSDVDSQEQAILAKQLLDYYKRELKLNKNQKLALEIAMINDLSWIFAEWDFTKGEPVRPDPFSGELVTTGEINVEVKTMLDVVIDVTQELGGKDDWQIKRGLINKYDLANRYPAKAEEIVHIQRDLQKDSLYRFGEYYYYGLGQRTDSPLIDIYTFYHRKTPSMPEGRMYVFLDGKTWLFDGPLPYDGLPGIRCCPTEKIASALGYSNANDLLSLQDLVDAAVSAAATNMTACGVNNIWCKPGNNLDFEKLAEGMNYMESEDKPEVLMLNKLAPEWFSFVNFLISRMEAISGVNSIARGNTEGKDFSGAAMALLQSMAIQFNSGLQEAYAEITEDLYNSILFMLQRFATTERTAAIVGKNNQYMMKAFTGQSIANVKRVFAQISNPLESTTAGKTEMAKDFMQIPGAITSPQQYLEVVRTGQIQSFVEDDEKDNLLVKTENEALLSLKPVAAYITDKHKRHIECHRAVMSDPSMRAAAPGSREAQIVEATTAHIQEHLNILRTADPGMLMLMGEQPIPPLPPPMPMGMPGQTPPTPMEGGSPNPPPENPMEAGVRPPSMPKNPLSGKEFDLQTGGLANNA